MLYSIDNGSTWQSNNGTFNGLSAGTYLCVVKDANDCDTSFVVEIQNEVLTWLQAVTGPGDHCLGNAASGPGLLDWYTGPTGSAFTNPSGDTIAAQFSAGQVTVYQPPEIISPTTDSKTACIGDFVSFMSFVNPNTGTPPFTFQWTWPDGHTTEDDPAFWSVTPDNAGDYTLLVTDLMHCTDQKSIRLIVSDNPVADFHGTDTLVVDSGYILDAGTGQVHYLWNTGDSTESIEIYSEGMYMVEMESQAGCMGSDSVYIVLREEPVIEPSQYFYIPNAFTPNSDGQNDIFLITISNSTFNIQHSTLTIFDRWGGKIFSSDDISTGWDGKKNGELCPGGVYVYRISFKVDGVPGIDGEQVITGTVTVVR